MLLHKLHESIDGALLKHGIWIEHQEVLARKTREREVIIGCEGIEALLFDYFDPRVPIPNKLH